MLAVGTVSRRPCPRGRRGRGRPVKKKKYQNIHRQYKSVAIKAVLEPAAQSLQALPPDILIRVLHELHDANLET